MQTGRRRQVAHLGAVMYLLWSLLASTVTAATLNLLFLFLLDFGTWKFSSRNDEFVENGRI